MQACPPRPASSQFRQAFPVSFHFQWRPVLAALAPLCLAALTARLCSEPFASRSFSRCSGPWQPPRALWRAALVSGGTVTSSSVFHGSCMWCIYQNRMFFKAKSQSTAAGTNHVLWVHPPSVETWGACAPAALTVAESPNVTLHYFYFLPVESSN